MDRHNMSVVKSETDMSRNPEPLFPGRGVEAPPYEDLTMIPKQTDSPNEKPKLDYWEKRDAAYRKRMENKKEKDKSNNYLKPAPDKEMATRQVETLLGDVPTKPKELGSWKVPVLKKPTESEERINKIRTSLEKINNLMGDLKKKNGGKLPSESEFIQKSNPNKVNTIPWNTESDYDDDLMDAIDHVNVMKNRNMEKGFSDVEFEGIYEGMDHSKLLPKTAFKGKQSGWLLSVPDRERATVFDNFIGRRGWVNNFIGDRIKPPIMIDDEIGDGFARIQYAHALGEDLPVAKFKGLKGDGK
jgi:hypothetical protein